MQNNNIHDDAQSLVSDLAQGNFVAVEQRLAPTIRPILPVERLLVVWQGLEQQVGSFVKQVEVQTIQTAHGPFEVVTCAFERAPLDINIAFNAAREITGLTVTPVGTVAKTRTMRTSSTSEHILSELSGRKNGKGGFRMSSAETERKGPASIVHVFALNWAGGESLRQQQPCRTLPSI